jgi:hypothetical protein
MRHCYLFHLPQAKIIQMYISEQERDAVYKTIFHVEMLEAILLTNPSQKMF